MTIGAALTLGPVGIEAGIHGLARGDFHVSSSRTKSPGQRQVKTTLQARRYLRLDPEVLGHQGELLKKVMVPVVKVFAF